MKKTTKRTFCVGVKENYHFGRNSTLFGKFMTVCFQAKSRKDAIRTFVKNLHVW